MPRQILRVSSYRAAADEFAVTARATRVTQSDTRAKHGQRNACAARSTPRWGPHRPTDRIGTFPRFRDSRAEGVAHKPLRPRSAGDGRARRGNRSELTCTMDCRDPNPLRPLRPQPHRRRRPWRSSPRLHHARPRCHSIRTPSIARLHRAQHPACATIYVRKQALRRSFARVCPFRFSSSLSSCSSFAPRAVAPAKQATCRLGLCRRARPMRSRHVSVRLRRYIGTHPAYPAR